MPAGVGQLIVLVARLLDQVTGPLLDQVTGPVDMEGYELRLVKKGG
jgi:hypothetical protein